MATKLLTERFAFTGGKIDRTGPGPVVRGLLLCGSESANRRRYKKEAFAGDKVKRYNGRPVFLNHAEGRGPRRYEDKIATIQNARHRADGMPIGDLLVNPAHPYAEAFLFDAEHNSSACGLSHVAHCATVAGRDGWEDVNDVVEVESVDVVTSPATTKGLYEGIRRGRTRRLRLSAIAEQVLRNPRAAAATKAAARRLREALGPVDGIADDEIDLPADDEPLDLDGSAEETAEALSAAYSEAIGKLVRKILAKSIDQAEGLARVAKLVDSYFGATSESRQVPTDGRAFASRIREGGSISPTAGKSYASRILEAGGSGPRLVIAQPARRRG